MPSLVFGVDFVIVLYEKIRHYTKKARLLVIYCYYLYLAYNHSPMVLFSYSADLKKKPLLTHE